MMGISLSIGNPQRRLAAEMELQHAEDELMKLDEHETRDLAFHVEKEAQRTQVLVMRARQLKQTMSERIDRNLWATVGVGVILLLKGVVTFTDLQHFITWAANHF